MPYFATHRGVRCEVKFERYQATNGVAIELVIADDIPDDDMWAFEHWATATVCLPVADCVLAPGNVLIKDYSENEGMVQCLVDAGIVERTEMTVPSGHAILQVCKLLVNPE